MFLCPIRKLDWVISTGLCGSLMFGNHEENTLDGDRGGFVLVQHCVEGWEHTVEEH